MTKYGDMFHDCIRYMLRDFELCPIIVPLKDCFIIFGMVVGTGNENKPFRTEQLCQIMQIIADFYLQNTDVMSESLFENSTNETSDTRALSLLKVIEMSKGYDTYRMERLISGTTKAPLLLSSVKEGSLSRN